MPFWQKLLALASAHKISSTSDFSFLAWLSWSLFSTLIRWLCFSLCLARRDLGISFIFGRLLRIARRYLGIAFTFRRLLGIARRHLWIAFTFGRLLRIAWSDLGIAFALRWLHTRWNGAIRNRCTLPLALSVVLCIKFVLLNGHEPIVWFLSFWK